MTTKVFEVVAFVVVRFVIKAVTDERSVVKNEVDVEESKKASVAKKLVLLLFVVKRFVEVAFTRRELVAKRFVEVVFVLTISVKVFTPAKD